MQDNLKRKTVSGMLWSSFQKFGTMGISFVSNIVLARLLTPEDYGCIGMLMIFILVANTFIDGGFGSALIQKKEPTQEDYSTIFYWNLFLSIVLYALLFFTSPLIASFYELPLLSSVLRVQGLVLILNSLSIIQQNRLRKQLLFKKLSVVSIVSALLSLGITIYLAYVGWGVWALVAQQLLMSLFNAVLFWIVGKWAPTFVFSKQSFKELFGFGGYILSSNLINTLCNNVQGLLIGKFFSPVTMGLYAQARKLEEVASTSISSIIDQVSFPVFSEFQDSKERLMGIIKKLTTLLAYFCFPIMIILIIVARPLIVLLYSEKWMDCVSYFQILCFSGMAVCLQNINYYAIAVIGRSQKLFVWTFIKRIVGIFWIIGGFWVGGVMGLLYGMVITSYMNYAVNAYLVGRYIGYSIISQIRDLMPIILLSLFVGFVTYFIQYLCLSRLVEMFLTIISYVVLYVLCSCLLRLYSFRILKTILMDLFAKKRSV